MRPKSKPLLDEGDKRKPRKESESITYGYNEEERQKSKDKGWSGPEVY